MLQINESSSTQVGLVWVSLDGCHAILVKSHHPLWNSTLVVVLMRVIHKAPKMVKEGFELLVFITSAYGRVHGRVIHRSEFRYNIYDIVKTQHTHVVVKTQSILNDFQLHLKHRD